MKFGKYLQSNKDPEWRELYIDYSNLKVMIKKLIGAQLTSPVMSLQQVSLSVPPPTNAAGLPESGGSEAYSSLHESFFAKLEEEMRKVEKFTQEQVSSIRKELFVIEQKIVAMKTNESSGWQEVKVGESERESLNKDIGIIGERFLRLEKFVNLNFTGLHKILKKHDRHLPNPCKVFYMSRLHNQTWVKSDHTDIIVHMSSLYSELRGDTVPTAPQNFEDSQIWTRKYWVRTENVSKVKYVILQHLPVRSEIVGSDRSDSRLSNSIYLENSSMELYHARLNNLPGAISLRIRWYGTGEPKYVDIERTIYGEAQTGEGDLTQRFTIPASEVSNLLNGEFDKTTELRRLRESGMSEEEIETWDCLVTEVIQAINFKQLVPTLRTQAMKTFFQVPFDPNVVASLDSNVLMLVESGDTEKWFRNPSKSLEKNEMTRFPHNILTIQIQFQGECEVPHWLTNLIDLGVITEVRQFSRFLHGCSILLQDEVQGVPYWIDDPSIADLDLKSQANDRLIEPDDSQNGENYNGEYVHFQRKYKAVSPKQAHLDLKTEHKQAISLSIDQENMDQHDDENCFSCCCFPGIDSSELNQALSGQIEPKIYFANERTFLHWLDMSVTLYSLSIVVLMVAKEGITEVYCLLMLPVSFCFAAYALFNYFRRLKSIKYGTTTSWEDPIGPIFVVTGLLIALTFDFLFQIYTSFAG